MSQNICTSQELKDFANTSEITITELSKFIENKTSQQYVIVQKDFVKAIIEQLFDNILNIHKVNESLSIIWIDIIQSNRRTTEKWDDHLKFFKY
jgi:hypothetical protein